MSEVIKNRYDFVILFDVENGNPNGDPDAGNAPRIDPDTGLGLVTDVCLKRKIRNYVETVKEDAPGYGIYIKDQVPLQRSDARALEYLGIKGDLKAAKKDDPSIDLKIRDFMCQNFYDIRTFGAVMTTFVKGNLNCGQVRGPVQLGFARSIDPILYQDEVTGSNPVISSIEPVRNGWFFVVLETDFARLISLTCKTISNRPFSSDTSSTAILGNPCAVRVSGLFPGNFFVSFPSAHSIPLWPGWRHTPRFGPCRNI